STTTSCPGAVSDSARMPSFHPFSRRNLLWTGTRLAGNLPRPVAVHRTPFRGPSGRCRMLRRFLPLGVLVLAAALGCVGDDPGLLVPVTPFSNGPAPQAPAQTSSAVPASAESATRVALVGQKILAANSQMGLRPVFRTIGAPAEEVFHHGTADV